MLQMTATLGAGGGAELVDSGGQVCGQDVLGFGGEFGALAGEVEDVDCGFAFGVDKGNLDVAFVCAEGKGNLTQQTRPILGDDLQKCGVGGRLRIELEARGDLDLYAGGVAGVPASFEHLLDRDLLGNHIVDVGDEAVFFAGVELDGAEHIGELETVDDDAGIVGKGAGLDDVHAPCGECAGQV